ncbi:MAG TPA: zinc-ribbon domain-containing protein [Candidatus Egerieimonas intestinavium]|uniref:Zinc-ribbon domain-containing protein n=1 Tax=Candidatus Egerieimonas intestinavium TaxID=2840777 RepID=A0A9D1JFU8_9FIRM|nr:zinc-ribbon domain-containing protein [Candidatus Egerieimonas intestinavium]
MYCKKCGAEARENDKFCMQCGALLTAATPSTPPITTHTYSQERKEKEVNLSSQLSQPVNGNWIKLCEIILFLKCIVFMTVFTVGAAILFNESEDALFLMLLFAILGFFIGVISCLIPYLLTTIAHNLHITASNNLILIKEVEKLQKQLLEENETNQ